MGKGSRRKGNVYERELVHILQDNGLVAYRQPLSGALAREEWKGDIKLETPDDHEYVIEVKYRSCGAGFRSLFPIMEGNHEIYLEHADAHVLSLTHFVKTFRDPEAARLYGLDGCHTGRQKYKQLRDWADGADFLALRAAKKPWLFMYFG